MYNNYPVRKILLQASTNGIFQLTRHFPTEKEVFMSWIRIYPCVHRYNFDLIKKRPEISCIEAGINA